MKHQQDKKGEGRRSLIKGFLTAGAVAVFGAAGSTKASAASKAPGPDGQEILYRETEEFRAYYRSLLD